MAMMQCPECKKEISDQAKTCPHCGAGNKAPDQVDTKTGCIIIFIAAIIILILTQVGPCAGGGGETSSAVTSTIAPEKYVTVEWKFSNQGFDQNEYWSPAKQGYGYYGVYVKITNHGYEKIPLNPLYFKLTDGKVGYTATSGPAIKREISYDKELYDGGTIDGYLAFELPKGEQNYHLVFDPGLIEDFNVRYK